ncbi:hypothetical protein KJ969_03285, partial [Patescibacteria group bacterium]|nr:hypothetical protein [Patescibacteria group bacterium]
EYLINLFKKKESRYASYFLRHFVKDRFGIDKKKYFDYKGFCEAYYPDKFKKYLDELGGMAYSTDSDKEAVELFREAHFQSQASRN